MVSHARRRGVKMTRGSTVPFALAAVEVEGEGTGCLSASRAASTASLSGLDFLASLDAAMDSRAEIMRIPETREDVPEAEMVVVEATEERRPAAGALLLGAVVRLVVEVMERGRDGVEEALVVD